jgi:hypothetical protein
VITVVIILSISLVSIDFDNASVQVIIVPWTRLGVIDTFTKCKARLSMSSSLQVHLRPFCFLRMAVEGRKMNTQLVRSTLSYLEEEYVRR